MAKICFLDNMTAPEDGDFDFFSGGVWRSWKLEDFDK